MSSQPLRVAPVDRQSGSIASWLQEKRTQEADGGEGLALQYTRVRDFGPVEGRA